MNAEQKAKQYRRLAQAARDRGDHRAANSYEWSAITAYRIEEEAERYRRVRKALGALSGKGETV